MTLYQNLKSVTGKKKPGYVDPKTGTRRATPWTDATEDGMYSGVNKEVWLYRVLDNVPLNFEDEEILMDHGNKVREIFADIGSASPHMPPFMQNAPEGFYRKIHIMSVRYWYYPESPEENSGPLRDMQDYEVLNKLQAPAQTVFIGIKLESGDSAARARTESFLEYFRLTLNELFQDNPTDYARFEKDKKFLEPLLRKNGCRIPTEEELRQLEAWFTKGSTTEPEIVANKDHLIIDRKDRLEFAALEKMQMKKFMGPNVQWLSETLDHDDGPAVISIRAELQPPADTRKALKKAIRAKEQADRERQEANKQEAIEETEDLMLTREAEMMYAPGGEHGPSLRNMSVIFGHRKEYEDTDETYADMLKHEYQISVKPLVHAQMQALEEVQPCGRYGSKFPQQFSLNMLAYSGLANFTSVGDKKGAFIGQGLPDGTPIYFDFLASSDRDMPPGTFIAGVPGSGKLGTLLTTIPTPSGRTTFGDVRVGDEVLGRDGRPHKVSFVSEVEETPELYDVHLSDGQVLRVCADHQWLVAGKGDRGNSARPYRSEAVQKWDDAQLTANALERLACEFGPDDDVTVSEMLELLGQRYPNVPWQTYIAVRAALEGSDSLSFEGVRSVTDKATSGDVYDVLEAVDVLRDAWQKGGPYASLRAQRASAAATLLDHVEPGEFGSLSDVSRLLIEAGAPFTKWKDFLRSVRKIVVSSELSPVSASDSSSRTRTCWPTAVALKSLAAQLRGQYGERPSEDVVERVLTTSDMLAEGVGTHSNFSIRVTEPLDLPDADFEIAPYVLGAWLGDSSETTNDINPDLITQLRTAGLHDNEHIPVKYLRGSKRQRLELLQGLMDTDGTIDKDGTCGLKVCSEMLAEDALDLIRSLGIKASTRQLESAVTEDGTDNPGQKRWSVHFTTTMQVFTLPHKVALLPETVSDSEHWLHITDIVPAPTEPGRCITVDSPDSTFLMGGYVPTHNTFLAQWMALQAALEGFKVSFINPKGNDTLGPIIPFMEEYGIKCEHVRISRLARQGGEGTFDPFRYARTPETAANMAANLITTVIDFNQKDRLAIRSAIRDGALSKARSTGEALEKGGANSRVVSSIRQLWETTPLFSLCVGWENPKKRQVGKTVERESGAMGQFILTEFDVDLNLPGQVQANSDYSDAERIALAAVRGVTAANVGILSGTREGGVMIMDEAHNLLSHPDTIALVHKLMREGRSLNVAQIYISQLVSDLLSIGGNHSLESYISRAIVLKMTDPKEAKAALRLIGYKPNPHRAKDLRDFGVQQGPDGVIPARGYFRDLSGRRSLTSFGPYSDSFMKAASTNRLDRLERDDDDVDDWLQ